MAGLFDLITADDLCAKLDHDYRRVKANSADVFAAFDFIVTAWHLLEWRASGVWAQGVWQDGLVIELAGAAKVALGDRLTMEQFADLIVAFWRGPGGQHRKNAEAVFVFELFRLKLLTG